MSVAVPQAAHPAPPPPPADPGSRLRVVDVTMFYGERSGGIRTYLEAKAAFAARTGRFEHHLVIPGRPAGEAADSESREPLCGCRHEHRSLRLAPSNGYRLPLGGGAMHATLRALAPDAVLLHDPFWSPRQATRIAHEHGAVVIAVHHASAMLHAAGLPGPHAIYAHALRRWYRRAYLDADAVMSVVDPLADTRRPATVTLRFGIDPAFHPRPEIARRDHVLYAGRLSREKGVQTLLHAAAAAPRPWPVELVGSGPAADALRDLAQRLGLADRVTFAPYESDRRRLAARFASARCVVLPGPHETFGLVALEAAACGAAVVTATATPSGGLLGDAVHTFRAGDSSDLLHAIERARRRTPDPAAAAALAARHGWDSVFCAELADLERLLEGRRRA